MATMSIADLEALLGGLDVNVPVPQFAAADILNNPLDVARCYLADIICSLVLCSRDTALKCIQPANGVADGDLAIRLPMIEHKTNYEDFGLDLKKKVWQALSFPRRDGRLIDGYASFQNVPSLVPHFRTVFIFGCYLSNRYSNVSSFLTSLIGALRMEGTHQSGFVIPLLPNVVARK
jgi:hypothetical protein